MGGVAMVTLVLAVRIGGVVAVGAAGAAGAGEVHGYMSIIIGG